MDGVINNQTALIKSGTASKRGKILIKSLSEGISSKTLIATSMFAINKQRITDNDEIYLTHE